MDVIGFSFGIFGMVAFVFVLKVNDAVVRQEKRIAELESKLSVK